MNAIEVTSDKHKYHITLDKSYFNKEMIFGMLEKMRIEQLAKKVDFDQSIEDLGEEIKSLWWGKNKKRFLRQSQ